jgi:hypothetical protein
MSEHYFALTGLAAKNGLALRTQAVGLGFVRSPLRGSLAIGPSPRRASAGHPSVAAAGRGLRSQALAARRRGKRCVGAREALVVGYVSSV